jgi:hypothetical protein
MERANELLRLPVALKFGGADDYSSMKPSVLLRLKEGHLDRMQSLVSG